MKIKTNVLYAISKAMILRTVITKTEILLNVNYVQKQAIQQKNVLNQTSKQKKIKQRLGCRVNNELLFESAKLSNENNILKISNNPNTLHIYAQLNQKEIPIDIDTGEDICCIKYDILPKNQTILNQTINLVGPDNQPLLWFMA